MGGARQPSARSAATRAGTRTATRPSTQTGTSASNPSRRGAVGRRHEDERYRGGPAITGNGQVAAAEEDLYASFPRDVEERQETERRSHDSPRWREEGVSASIFGEGGGTRGLTPGTRLHAKQAAMRGAAQEGNTQTRQSAERSAYPQRKGQRLGGGHGVRRNGGRATEAE